MTSYTNPFTGQTLNPSDVGYESLTISNDTFLEWPVNGNNTNVVSSIIEVTATTTGLRLALPAATQVSTGQSLIVRNIGSNAFTVTNIIGGTITSVPSGIAQYIYLTDNTTQNGTWAVVTFGAGTSAANAATLAGYGLMAINTTLNQAYNVTQVYSNYTFLSADRAGFFVWDSGAGTFTMPTASSVGNNWFVMIRNNGTGILNIVPSGTDTIDGNANAQLQIGESFVICSNGSSYNTFAYGRSAQFFFTQLNKVVTGGTVTLSSAEAANLIQEYTGTLTSNCTVILPPTVQLYSLQNKTTGSYSLTFKTAAVGASTVILPQNQTIIAICDGTNVYNSQTAIGSITSITLANGSAAAPSLNFIGDTTTGLYLIGSGQMGVAVSGSNAATFTSTGLLVPVGIPGGSF